MAASPAIAATASPTRRARRTHHRPEGSGWLARGLSALLALAAALLGLWLAGHHPLGAVPALAGFGVVVLLAARWPAATALTLLPALLPVLALAPWTGWLLVEEFDLLLLATLAGGHARLAWPPAAGEAQGAGRGPAVSVLAWVLLALWAASVAIGLQRGVADAGGWAWGWTQGYREAMNSLRLAKPLVGVLLWWPLWRAARRRDPAAAEEALLRGLTLGLAGCALAALWERAAFTDVLNFSSDYRTTALFWEMHVGGAALDGYLALTLPWALQLALTARRRVDQVLAGLALALAAYAALTTFSRIVYLALPAGLVLMGGLLLRQRLAGADAAARRALWRALLPGLGLAAGFALAAGWMFAGAGYRGLLALFGAMLVMLPLAAVLRRFGVAEWSAGLALGGVLAGLGWAATLVLGKGAYLAYAGCALATAALLVWRLRRGAAHGPDVPGALVLAGFIGMLAGAVLVAAHWGEDRGLRHALPPVLALAGVLAWAARRPGGLWPEALRWQALTAGALFAAAAAVAVFGGGAYMAGRMAASQSDLGGREQHWRFGLGLPQGTVQQVLGLGLGRYLEQYALASGGGGRPGDYRQRGEPGQGHLVLIAGTHTQGWGEILRVSQRIATPQGAVGVAFRARSSQPVVLHFDVCRKHLLYDDGGCQTKGYELPSTQGQWQSFAFPLDGEALAPDAGWLPRFVVFSIGSETSAASIDIDDLSLRDRAGRELLHNGGFEDTGSGAMARWFFSSDKNHLPWHAKNLQVHLAVEQGWLGLGAFMLLWAAALWRVSLGSARGLALAPALAASLLGFLIVGAVDSLLDMPRVAWQYQALLLLALTLQPARPPRLHGGAAAAGPTTPEPGSGGA